MPIRSALRFTLAALVLSALAHPASAAAEPTVRKPTPIPSIGGATAPAELVEDANGLKLNWTTGKLTISGVGIGGDRGSMSFRRTLSARAAQADAYRRLASALELVRVDANTRLKDLAVADDALRTRLNDYIKGAKVLETNYWPDGSTEVVLGANLKGDNSLAAMIAGTAVPAPEAAATGANAPASAPSKEVVTAPVAVQTSYSSVIVDARGLGAQPALLPNLRDSGGKVVELADGAKPAIKYLRDGGELDRDAGVNPLKLRATRTQGTLRADLVLADDASKTLKQALVEGKIPATTPIILIL